MRTTRPANAGCAPQKSPNFRGKIDGLSGREVPLQRADPRKFGCSAGLEPAGGAGRPQDRQPRPAGHVPRAPRPARSEGGSCTGRAPQHPAGPAARRAPSATASAADRSSAGVRSHQMATAARPNTSAISAWRWMTKSIVPRPLKSRRLIFCPGEPPAGGRRRWRRSRRRSSGRPARSARRTRPHDHADRWRPPSRSERLARPPDEHHGCDQDQHREREVAHDPAVVERPPSR